MSMLFKMRGVKVTGDARQMVTWVSAGKPDPNGKFYPEAISKPLEDVTVIHSWQDFSRLMPSDSADLLWWPCNDESIDKVVNAIKSTQSSGDLKTEGTVLLGQMGVDSTAIDFRPQMPGRARGAEGFTPKEWTISAWVQPRPQVEKGHIVNRSWGPNHSLSLGIVVYPAGNVIDWGVILCDETGAEQEIRMRGYSSMRAWAWHHVGATLKDGYVQAVIDGNVVGAMTAKINWGTAGNWGIGGNGDPSDFETFNGTICDVRVASIARPIEWFQEARRRVIG
jgi:hypothetical protein